MNDENLIKYETLKNKIIFFNVENHIKAFMAGIFIAFGCIAMGVVKLDHNLSPAISSVLSGMIFSIGLFAIVVCGSRLFTGNCLVWINVLNKEVSIKQFTLMLLHDWAFNFLGIIFIVICTNLSGFDCSIFNSILNSKIHSSLTEMIFKGILCNMLVCLAVWMAIGSANDKFIKILIPVTVFIMCGFEHSIADMFFVLFFIRDMFQSIDLLLLVTFGNLVGGIIFSSLIYYSSYMKMEKHNA